VTRRLPALTLLAALATAGLAAGCAAPISRVSRGETLATGDTLFDDFFIAVRDVRTEALAAQADELASHAGLIKALGLEPKTSPASAVGESGLRAKRLQDKGVLLHLEIAPDAKLMTVKAKFDPGAEGEALFKAMEEAAKSSLDMRRRLVGVALRAGELERRRVTLRTQASATFRDASASKREEIIFELDAAQPVLTDAGERSSNAAGAAARFVVELAQAVETGAGTAVVETKLAKGARKPPAAPIASTPTPPVVVAAATPTPRPAPAAAPARPAPAKPAPAATKPAAAPAKPAPAKKKPKGGGDDFEP